MIKYQNGSATDLVFKRRWELRWEQMHRCLVPFQVLTFTFQHVHKKPKRFEFCCFCCPARITLFRGMFRCCLAAEKVNTLELIFLLGSLLLPVKGGQLHHTAASTTPQMHCGRYSHPWRTLDLWESRESLTARRSVACPWRTNYSVCLAWSLTMKHIECLNKISGETETTPGATDGLTVTSAACFMAASCTLMRRFKSPILTKCQPYLRLLLLLGQNTSARFY